MIQMEETGAVTEKGKGELDKKYEYKGKSSNKELEDRLARN